MTPLEALAAAWRAAESVVVLTGAGLSTASGIPDFRSPAGRWERYRPVPLPDFLARAGRVALLVTQNVDGLHERSGFPADRLVSVHGADSAVECMRCHRRAPREVAQAAWEAGTAVPRCPCGGPWKPDAGTSLVVGPVNEMFPVARAAGARTAILTASETPFDAAADWKLDGALAEVLPALRDVVLG
ncbi:MAG TPA: Sir2 family NAD-dependent protein deacetylase [Candidatus Binatia bacterium]|jgi:NAD-dependent deacetylase|nr:Sir2 family NAD-dependent protein deacetylase [Candidatus Binatia bacterium]